MVGCRTAAAVCVMACLLAPAVARATTTVRVVETHPSGDYITLARNENFNLRLAYSTDQPAGIWIAPYYQGQRANVGTSPSPRYTGSGETMTWFFFMKPGDSVDEIRISAGDGGVDTTPVVATHRVSIVGGADLPAAQAAPPPWVAVLGERARQAQREARMSQAAAPTAQPGGAGALGSTALMGGFMLGVLGLAAFGLGAPIWAMRRWRGGWRVAAAVPAALMGFVVARIVIGVAADPTSHNLWPFEILMAAPVAGGLVLLLMALRRFKGVGRD